MDEECRKLMPGGSSHGIRHYPPYPFYAAKAKGSKVWDVDGNEYVDYWMGHYALILGHAHPSVTRALTEQLKDGTHWGMLNPLEVQLAKLIKEHVPCAERVRFCSSGAEATMYAVRLARGFTSRNVVLKVEGGWHGFCTDLMVAIHKDFDVSESLGLFPELSRYTRSIPFNDCDAAAEIIRKTDDLAAIIVEPILGAGGFIPADKEYLKGVQEEAQRKGALLIFDEIVTGFRLGLGGAQAYYGIVPDLVAMGKILGGGLPIGAIAGREEIMELSNTKLRGKANSVSIGGGTFSCNPLTMRAGLATIQYLVKNKQGYEKIGSFGENARKGIEKAFREKGITARCTGIGSLFQTHFPFSEDVELKSARDVYYKTDCKTRDEELKLRLINEGIYAMHGGGAVSFAHSRSDINRLIRAAEKVASDMRAESTFPSR